MIMRRMGAVDAAAGRRRAAPAVPAAQPEPGSRTRARLCPTPEGLPAALPGEALPVPRPPRQAGGRRCADRKSNDSAIKLLLLTLTVSRATLYSQLTFQHYSSPLKRQGRWPADSCVSAGVCRHDQLHRAHRAADAGRRRAYAALSFIDLREVLVFARFGRSDAEGAFATCHCLTLPASEPGYYFWRDREHRRADAPLRVVRHQVPDVRVGGTRDQVPDLVRAAALLRPDARRARARRDLYPRRARLDREARHGRPRALSHRSRRDRHPRAFATPTARDSPRSHGPQFYEDVAEMVQAYLASDPDPALLRVPAARFRRADRALRRRGGDDVPELPVVSAALHGSRSTCRRRTRCVKVEPLKPLTQPVLYTEDDLHIRQFTDSARRARTALPRQGPATGAA